MNGEPDAVTVKPGRSGLALASHIVLWCGALILCALAGAMFLSPGGDAAGRGLSQGFGMLLALIGGAAVVAMLLAFRWRAWLWVAGAIVALPIVALIAFWIFGLFAQARYQQERADSESGKADFRNDPALLAVAHAVAKNDPDAIRAAAKNVPDLNAAGEEGKTLLYFAVDEALEKPEMVKAVQTLLSLGADPNYNNGQLNSFALWRAVAGSRVDLLRAMLDAGGNPNGPDFRGNPVIFFNWELTFNEADRPVRFHLLLERGADVNSAYPEKSSMFAGYSLVLARVNSGISDRSGYTDAIELLERGADPKHAAVDGTNLVRQIETQRREFAEWKQEPPPEFQALCDWLTARNLLPKQP
ncbi:MAG: hypothetical protein ACJ8HU_05260 [Chthoniobacterales bacterium]